MSGKCSFSVSSYVKQGNRLRRARTLLNIDKRYVVLLPLICKMPSDGGDSLPQVQEAEHSLTEIGVTNI